jgi:hypothetical protein
MSNSSGPGHEDAQSALSREWLIARIVIVGGFIAAIAAIVWFGWVQPEMQHRELLAKVEKAKHEVQHAAIELCRTGLASAQSFGIVPPYGQLVGQNIYRTNVQGRYVCVAATHAARYLVAVDLVCRNLADRRCVSLFSVVNQGSGSILYQRQS